jgi:hypothetical protein
VRRMMKIKRNADSLPITVASQIVRSRI